ncbi:MAG: regulatory signaling modulator protein AmpE [Gammaproteobacteria bacterium]|nr:regulatory signaling modulator protein AmpE [Gammaproteobacteria bacterium]MCP4091574.1 regulatory signaling modulator protein AmpE [Gammaproteobacteria bacterium]MCP4276070.1 regulatory signaling modulator protein AmpE [Gammaproteobacteria bacterium]MCP4832562.1 regulatory signaling modulator protein AmpE [Gammaproteobacteria bacterium]MCP4929640.1 regulatory signaling modulator protein AmpE [Gammaproteobacteria bacterium]
MNFLALLLGLAVERLLTHFFHWREFHWLDPIFDWCFQRVGKADKLVALGSCLALVAIILLPVVLIFIGLLDRFAHIPLFIFSVFVLLFCLGPRDLGEEVDEYRKAVIDNNPDEAHMLASELLEYEPEAGVMPDVEHAIYAQANNRIFGVVFWFAVLGPVGAWLFRVLDLMRRRAIHYYIDISGDQVATQYLQSSPIIIAALKLHQFFAWVPSRLLMIGYAMAGDYDSAVSAWRNPPIASAELFPAKDEQLLGAIGCAAAPDLPEDDVPARAQIAIDFVIRTLWMIWCPVLALLTIYGAIN